MLPGWDLPGWAPEPTVRFEPVTAEPGRSKLLGLAPAGTSEIIVPVTNRPADPLACAAAGAEVYRLRLALAAANHRAAWVPVPPAVLAELVPMPTGAATLGMIAIGPAPV